MSFVSLLQAAGTAGSASTTGALTGTLLPFLLIIVIFYFFLIRPQNKKQKETEKMLAALKKGDKVITIGGIHGTISSVKEKTVIVKVDENVKLEFNRSAISSVEKTDAEKAAEADAKAAKKGKKSSETAEAPAATENSEENK